MLEKRHEFADAKFGGMLLREGDAFRSVAMHNVPPAFAECVAANRSFDRPLTPRSTGWRERSSWFT